jgi:hypothetical protein
MMNKPFTTFDILIKDLSKVSKRSAINNIILEQ